MASTSQGARCTTPPSVWLNSAARPRRGWWPTTIRSAPASCAARRISAVMVPTATRAWPGGI
jgi:hypothetical protein